MERPAAVAETHVSTLFFVGDRVYKAKKPVALDFVDFSTREARERACHREVELNRRLAPDVYLGVADVVGPDGERCDHLVVMRRMPPERRLASLVAAGEPVDAGLRAVVDRVAAFHRGAARSPAIDAAATADARRAGWRANAAAMVPFVGPVLDPAVAERVDHLAGRWLDGRAGLLARRIAAGRVCDGHGDLLADDIFLLDDGPAILDCLEFDDRLRHGDVVADIAFLVMDLERLGRPDLGAAVIDRYRQVTGDDAPASLVDHHVAARAQVRAKVACLRWAQGDEAAAPAARSLLDLCLRHLEAARVRLVLVGGPPGTGKSTLAAELAAPRGWPVLRSDVVRKELPVGPGDASAAGEVDAGRYAPERVDAVYDELLGRARELLGAGRTVVLDASWGDARWRARAAELADATASDLVALRCAAPPDVAAARVARRRGDASDATPEVAAALAARFDPWPEATTVDTAGERGRAAAEVAAAVVDAAGGG